MRDAAGPPLHSVTELLVEAERAWAFDAVDVDPFRERVIRPHIGDYPSEAPPRLQPVLRMLTEW